MPDCIWLTKLTQRIERTDLISMGDDIRKLRDPEELIKAEAVYDLMYRMNKDNPVFKEESVMSGIRDLFAEEFKMHEEKEKDLEKKLAKSEKERAKSEKERAKSEKELARERKRIKELEALLASQKMGSKAL